MKYTQNTDFDAAKHAVDKSSYRDWLEDSRLDETEKENDDSSSPDDSQSPLDSILNFLADGIANATWRERLGALDARLFDQEMGISDTSKASPLPKTFRRK